MINAKLGAGTLSWVCPPWNSESGLYAIQQTANAGFDLIEILLPNDLNFDAETVKKQLKQFNIGVVCGMNLSADYHIPTHPKAAIQLIKGGIDLCRTLESPYLGGVLHSAIGVFSGKQRTPEEENVLFEVWGEIGQYAKKYGITIGIEPINRYESYMCTGAEETIELIRRSGAENIGLHLDTFHMNIEEQDFYNPIISAGDLLKHIHMTENDRGMLGEGHVDWGQLFTALNEINYQGRLVLENFSNSIPYMTETVSLWRPSSHDASDLAKGSLRFMRQMINDYSK